MKDLKVYEIRLKIFMLQDVKQKETYTVIGDYLDSYLAKEKEFLTFHETNRFKMYVYDQPYPMEEDGIYKKGKIYTIRIRTVRSELAQYLSQGLENHYNDQLKGLTLEIRIIAKKVISHIYSITPAIIKCSANQNEEKKGGYWKNSMSFVQYENRVKSNLIKKYNELMNTKIDEDFQLYQMIEFKNKVPVAIPYKGVQLLGDKLNIQAAHNEMSQNLLYMALGTGVCEMNSRGAGFMNYRYL